MYKKKHKEMDEQYRGKYDNVFDFLEVHVAAAQDEIDDIMHEHRIIHNHLERATQLTAAIKAWDEFKQYRAVLRTV